jgi:hypothetical protein
VSYPVVARATFSPAKCAASGDLDGPFFDFGTVRALNPRIYLHVPVIEACARQLGYVPSSEITEMAETVAQATEEVRALKEKVAALETIQEAEKVLVDA